MQFSKDELNELTTQNGGRFACQTLDEAYKFCRKISTSHYENFPVASLIIPQKVRKHIFAIYAFARVADDIADELTDDAQELRISSLNEMINLLEIDYFALDSKANRKNPIFFALQDTIQLFRLPISLFQRLINAFKQDVLFEQPENFEDVFAYCNNSANPVGELVLRLFNINSIEMIGYSNSICTSLQLINFWQDISIDKKKGRIYIPKDILMKYNLDKLSLFESNNIAQKRMLLNELYEITLEILNNGKPLINHLKPLRLKLEIKAIVFSGERILKKIRKIAEKVLYLKIKLSIFDIIVLALKTLYPKV